MWEKIGSDLKCWNWKQCEQRFKTVLKRKKTSVDNNKRSGAKRIKVEFEEELRKISNLDDSVDPDIQLSSQHCIKKKYLEPEPGTSTSSSKAKPEPAQGSKQTAQEMMIQMFKTKEEAKERRHKEKMEQSEKLQSLLAKILEKQ